MGYLVAVAQKEFKTEMSKLLTRRIKMLSSLANQYQKLLEQADESSIKIGAAVIEHTYFVKRITKIDDDFSEAEEEFFKDYRKLIQDQRKILKSVDMIEQLDLAVAEVKNKLNLAVTAVRQDAISLFSPAQDAGVTGVPMARLEYLKDLTLEKELRIFHEIIDEKDEDL